MLLHVLCAVDTVLLEYMWRNMVALKKKLTNYNSKSFLDKVTFKLASVELLMIKCTDLFFYYMELFDTNINIITLIHHFVNLNAILTYGLA